MLKLKIIFILCLFISMSIFSSCGDVNKPEHDFILASFNFAKVSVDPVFNYPSLGTGIIECTVDDTIALKCCINYLNRSELPKSLTAKISDTRGNSRFFIELFDWSYVAYITEYPPPPRLYAAVLPKEVLLPSSDIDLSDIDLSGRILLIAEIIYKGRIIKTALNINIKR